MYSVSILLKICKIFSMKNEKKNENFQSTATKYSLCCFELLGFSTYHVELVLLVLIMLFLLVISWTLFYFYHKNPKIWVL